jgi:hypothetical protein
MHKTTLILISGFPLVIGELCYNVNDLECDMDKSCTSSVIKATIKYRQLIYERPNQDAIKTKTIKGTLCLRKKNYFGKQQFYIMSK